MAIYTLKAAINKTDIAALCALHLQLTNHLAGKPFEPNVVARLKSRLYNYFDHIRL